MRNNIDKLPYSDTVKEALHRLVEYTVQAIPNVVYIALFGSYARLEQNIRSDLDILVLVSRDFTIHERALLRDIYENYHADVVMFTVDDYRASDSKLVMSMKEDGILLWKS